MRRKRMLIGLLLIVGFMVCLSSCSKVKVGEQGIKVHLLGSSKGVDTEILGPGRYWIGINKKLFVFPTFTQNYTWTQDKTEGSPTDQSITFQTREGLSVNADVGISYHINPNKVTAIFEKYRKGIDEITGIYLRNMVRDAFNLVASTKPVEAAYGEGKGRLIQEVVSLVKQEVEKIGIIIEKIYLVGSMRLPPSVVKALNLKIEATQRAHQRKNEVAEATAQANKDVAVAIGKAKAILTVAEAQAQANKILARSITAELIKYKATEKWDGKVPTIMGTGVMPMINFK